MDVIVMNVLLLSLLFTGLILIIEAAAAGGVQTSVSTCTNEESSAGVFGKQLLGTKKRASGIRIELIHRDNFTASSKVDRYTRIQLAVQRSKLRVKSLGSLARAFSMCNDSRRLKDFTTSLSSDPTGVYLMQLQLGTPVTSFHAIADTGSDLVWVQCQPCQSCYPTNDPIFDPSSSSSYSELSCDSQACQALGRNAVCGGSNCQYKYRYGDRSYTRGDFSTETLTMTTTSGDSVAISSFAFGCGYINKGTFAANAGGLVGLGRGPISLISQLSSHLDRKEFSYCLVSFGDSITTTSPLFLGSAATLSGAGIGVTPILDAAVPSFYYVGVTGIDVGGSALNIPSSSFDSSSAGTIFDSGTTFTHLEDQAYSIVKSAFSSLISLPTVDESQRLGLDLCYDISSQPSFQPPSFTIHLLGASFSPPAGNCFVLVDTNVVCLAITSVGTLKIPSILGNILQQNYLMQYDLTNSQISFQQAACDSL